MGSTKEEKRMMTMKMMMMMMMMMMVMAVDGALIAQMGSVFYLAGFLIFDFLLPSFRRIVNALFKTKTEHFRK